MRDAERGEPSEPLAQLGRGSDEAELSEEFRRHQAPDRRGVGSGAEIRPAASSSQEFLRAEQLPELPDQPLGVEAGHDDLLGHTGKRGEQRELQLAFFESWFGIVGQNDIGTEEHREGTRIAAGRSEILPESGKELREERLAGEVSDQDAVRVPGSQTPCAGTERCQIDGHVRLDRCHAERPVVDSKADALESGTVRGLPPLPEEFDRLRQSVQRCGSVDAESALVELRLPAPEAEKRTPPGETVQRGDRHGELHWMSEMRARYPGAESDPLGADRSGARERDSIPAVRVFAQPDRVKACLVDSRDRRQCPVDSAQWFPRTSPTVVREIETEFHARFLSSVEWRSLPVPIGACLVGPGEREERRFRTSPSDELESGGQPSFAEAVRYADRWPSSEICCGIQEVPASRTSVLVEVKRQWAGDDERRGSDEGIEWGEELFEFLPEQAADPLGTEIFSGRDGQPDVSSGPIFPRRELAGTLAR